jgi:hypothetical protein
MKNARAPEDPEGGANDGSIRPKGAPYFPTDEKRIQVQTMSGLGINEDHIALVLGIHRNTLRKHHADDLELGRVTSNQAVAQALFNAAMKAPVSSHGVVAAIFWLKTKGGWKQDGPEDPAGQGPKVRVITAQLVEEVPAKPTDQPGA